MPVKIALCGNPNSGKTTLFNKLTGTFNYVGNWPGVTVEKKEGKLSGNKDVILTDLPGIYSLSPYTPEEVIARRYIIEEKPDVVINLVDASNIERNLYLTTQVCELGVPVVIALNMMDVVEKTGDKIDSKKLGEELGCEVVEISALKGTGCKELASRAVAMAQSGKAASPHVDIYSDTRRAIEEIESLLPDSVPDKTRRWFAVKLFERDAEAAGDLKLTPDILQQVEQIVKSAENELDDDTESIITGERYAYIGGLIDRCVKRKRTGLSTSDKIDRVVTNRWLALPIFVVVMFIVYFVSISTVGTWMTDWVNEDLFEEIVPEAVEGFLENIGTNDVLTSLVVDGIIAGVGAVLGFLPQMLVLFLFLAILEDCGYMSRVAFIMDRIFRKFGLSGKSFIPMLVASGCGVPGVMASRTIESDSDRRMTVTTACFIPCGAKLPIIALISGAVFGQSAWVAASAYFLGIGAVVISGIMLKKTKPFAGDPSPFVMELPAYHFPGVRGVLRTMFERGKAFVKKAGTIVLLATVLIWFLSSFGVADDGFGMVEDTEDSVLASVGSVVAPIFKPLGFGEWEATVSTVTGLIAKENVVGTMGVLYAGLDEDDISEEGEEFWGQFAAAFTPLAAYSFLVFNLLCAPCFAAIGAIRREMMSGKWTWFAVGYMCVFAYAISLIVYQLGTLFTGGGFGVGTVFAFAFIALILFMLFKKPYRGDDVKSVSSVEAMQKA